jgi:hypothetical protein
MALIHGRSTYRYSFMSCEYFASNFLASSTLLAFEAKGKQLADITHDGKL